MPDYPQEGALRGGHIPGAQSVPWARAAAEDGTFKARADWSPEWLALQIQAQCTALNQAREHLQGVAEAPELPVRQAPETVSAAELLALRDEGNRQVGEVMAWVADHRERLPLDVAQSV